MCGRFTLRTPTPVLLETFRVSTAPDIAPRYNVAPTQSVLVLRLDPETAQRQLTRMTWGLVPFWAKDPSIGNRLINARAETVVEKPAFRAAVRKRRCLVAADGYFEWKKLGTKKQPYWIRMPDGRPFGMAGLWEAWYGPDRAAEASDAAPLLTCTIITTDANQATAPIHDRMPVILDESHWDEWLDIEQQDPHALARLLHGWDGAELRMDPVSTRVNNPRNDDVACVEIQ